MAAYLATLATTHAGAPRSAVGSPPSAAHPAIRNTLAGIARQHGTPRRGPRTTAIRRLIATGHDGLTYINGT